VQVDERKLFDLRLADATLDADDEIVIMAADAGGSAAAAPDPSTVVAGSRVRVTVNDPLDGGIGYVYGRYG
jgi:hypothetical protein